MLAFFILLTSSYATTSLTIAHTNDVHARISQAEVTGGYSGCDDPASEFDASTHSAWFTGCHGGAARRKTMVDQLRSTTENFLLLDAGDEFQGTLWYNIYKSEATAYVMNALQYDAIALGNHEFDDGEEELNKYLDYLDPTTPVLVANMIADQNSAVLGKYNRSVVKTLTTGEQVGIIGYVIEDSPALSNPGQYLTFTEEIAAIQAEVDILTAAGVNIIIGVGHVGWATDMDIAASVDGIDVVIGGHTDTFCYTGDPLEQSPYAYPTTPDEPYPTEVDGIAGKVCVAQAYTYGTWLGKMDVEFDSNGNVVSCGGNPIFLSGETVVQDPAMLNWTLANWEAIEESYNTIEGKSRAFASGQKPVLRRGESALMDYYTDALVDVHASYANSIALTKSRIAMCNAGGMRADMPSGDVSLGDIMLMMPFGNDITVLTSVPGSVIVDVLEHGVSKWEETDGRFIHFSGVRYSFDPDQPVGHRITEASILCSTCEELVEQDLLSEESQTETWDIITLIYLVKGGDGYDMLPQYWDGTGGYFVDYDVIVQHLQDHSPVIPRETGRITQVNNTELRLSTGACMDYARTCSSLSAQCSSDGTITVDGEKLYCYATCSCPTQQTCEDSVNKDESSSDSNSDLIIALIIVIILLVVFNVGTCVYFLLWRDSYETIKDVESRQMTEVEPKVQKRFIGEE